MAHMCSSPRRVAYYMPNPQHHIPPGGISPASLGAVQVESSTHVATTPAYRKRSPAMGPGTQDRTLPPATQTKGRAPRRGSIVPSKADATPQAAARPKTPGGSVQQLHRHVEMFRDFQKVNSDVVDVQTHDNYKRRQPQTATAQPTLYSINTLRTATAKKPSLHGLLADPASSSRLASPMLDDLWTLQTEAMRALIQFQRHERKLLPPEEGAEKKAPTKKAPKKKEVDDPSQAAAAPEGGEAAQTPRDSGEPELTPRTLMRRMMFPEMGAAAAAVLQMPRRPEKRPESAAGGKKGKKGKKEEKAKPKKGEEEGPPLPTATSTYWTDVSIKRIQSAHAAERRGVPSPALTQMQSAPPPVRLPDPSTVPYKPRSLRGYAAVETIRAAMRESTAADSKLPALGDRLSTPDASSFLNDIPAGYWPPMAGANPDSPGSMPRLGFAEAWVSPSLVETCIKDEKARALRDRGGACSPTPPAGVRGGAGTGARRSSSATLRASDAAPMSGWQSARLSVVDTPPLLWLTSGGRRVHTAAERAVLKSRVLSAARDADSRCVHCRHLIAFWAQRADEPIPSLGIPYSAP